MAFPAEYWLDKALERVTIGNRSETGIWLAAQLRDNRVPFVEARQVMSTYAEMVPKEAGKPYTEREAMASLRQAWTRVPRDPAGDDAYEVLKPLKSERQREHQRMVAIAALADWKGVHKRLQELEPMEPVYPDRAQLERVTNEMLIRMGQVAFCEDSAALMQDVLEVICERLRLGTFAAICLLKKPRESAEFLKQFSEIPPSEMFEMLGIDHTTPYWNDLRGEGK